MALIVDILRVVQRVWTRHGKYKYSCVEKMALEEKAESRVTGWVCEKNRPECSKTHFCGNQYLTFTLEKIAQNLGFFYNQKICPKQTIALQSKIPPNLVTLLCRESRWNSADRQLKSLKRRDLFFFGLIKCTNFLLPIFLPIPLSLSLPPCLHHTLSLSVLCKEEGERFTLR
jgi:hypothetical protein